MADIQFNFKAKDLEQIQKILDQMVAATAQIKANIGSPQSKAAAKEMASEAKRAKVELDKQNKALEAQQGIIGGLQAEIKQWKIAMTKATDPAGIKKAQDEIAKLNGKLIDAKGSTNQWGKALDSFQFKFNALGNIAANALSGMTTKLLSVTREFISFEKVLRSTQGTSDQFDKSIAGLKGSFDFLAKSIASGNLTDFFQRLGEATNAAMNYAASMDELGDRTLAASIQTSEFEKKITELKLRLKEDSKYTKEERKQFALDIKTLSEQELAGQLKLANDSLDALTASFQGFSQLTKDEQLKFVGGYEKNIDTIRKVEEKLAAEQKLRSIEAARGTGDFSGNIAEVKNELILLNAEFGNDANLQEWYNLYVKANFLTDENRKGLADSVIRVNNLSSAYSQGLVRVTSEYETLLREITSESKKDHIDFLKQEDEKKKAIEERIRTYFNNLEEIKAADESWENTEMERIARETQVKKDALDQHRNDVLANQKDITAIIDANLKEHAELTKQNAEELDAIEQLKAQKKQAIIQATANLAFALSDLMLAKNTSAMNAELIAAEGNEKKQDEIRKKYAKKEQAISISQAIIAGAESVANVWSKWAAVPPVAAALSALALATVGIQIATIKAQKFAKGGEVGGRLHSEGGTLIEAEKEEFVINRHSYKKYKGLVHGINEDDQMKILASLHMDRRVEGGFKQDEYTKKLYELMKDKEVGYETPEFFVIHKGTKTIKLKKH